MFRKKPTRSCQILLFSFEDDLAELQVSESNEEETRSANLSEHELESIFNWLKGIWQQLKMMQNLSVTTCKGNNLCFFHIFPFFTAVQPDEIKLTTLVLSTIQSKTRTITAQISLQTIKATETRIGTTMVWNNCFMVLPMRLSESIDAR